MHYLVAGFMFALGASVFLYMLRNWPRILSILRDALDFVFWGSVVLLGGAAVLAAIAGCGYLMFSAPRLLREQLALREFEADTHVTPLEAARQHLSGVTIVPALYSPTPEQACFHTTGLPFAKAALFTDCVGAYRALLLKKTRPKDAAFLGMAMRYEMATTNKAQSLCVFNMLSDAAWWDETEDSQQRGLLVCLDRNRPWDAPARR